MGLEPYSLQSDCNKKENLSLLHYDDTYLVWLSNTIAYHRPSRTVYSITLTQDRRWLESTHQLFRAQSQPITDLSMPSANFGHIFPPDKAGYIDRIREAQEYIKAGESYELCLTASSQVHHSSAVHRSGHYSWYNDPRPRNSNASETKKTLKLYDLLRNLSPAAFISCIISLDIALLSASLEMFLSFDVSTRKVTIKPIKGTLKEHDENGGKIEYAEAQKALPAPKVIAENLIILDLVRNDLAKVSSDVYCSSLMHVEEIETVYQLVSTVKDKARAETTAWDLLQSALPLGSMTGAPKRRSCQILQKLEKHDRRGLNSGVVGYIDVRGNCETSVSIRSAARYLNEPFWRIGAGGAITSLSDALDEWQERQLKCYSVERVSQPRLEVLETVLREPGGGLRRWGRHVERLLTTLEKFGFQVPSILHDCQSEISKRDDCEIEEKMNCRRNGFNLN